MSNIAICAIAKLENKYIREWVEHHKKIGFDNIILLDNNDPDGERFEEVIGDYIDSGYVILLDVRGRERYQVPGYNIVYSSVQGRFDWLAFIDIDEFLDLDCGEIHKFIDQPKFDEFNAICVNWVTYNDMNLLKADGNYTMDRFTEISTLDKSESQNKKIVRVGIPKVKINSPHAFKPKAMELPDQKNDEYIKKYVKCCNVLGQPCEINVRNDNWTWKVARLKHFRYKSIQEFLDTKKARGYPTGWLNNGKDIGWKQYFAVNDVTKDKLTYINQVTGQPISEIRKTLGMSNQVIPIYYWKGRPNVGDYFGYWLVTQMGYDLQVNTVGGARLATVGSILEHKKGITDNTLIWGSGLHNESSETNCVTKSNYYAVRGTLTRDRLRLPKNIPLGDPGLLVSRYYKPNIKPTHKFGIICHALDFDMYNERYGDKYKIISVRTNDVEAFLDELLDCEFIFSSSLHGIIFAHSYGIPAIHLESINVGSKGGFKFKDYFSVLDIKYEKLDYNEKTFDNDIIRILDDDWSKYVPDKTIVRNIQNGLLKAFPFLKGSVHPTNNNSNQVVNTATISSKSLDPSLSYDFGRWM